MDQNIFGALLDTVPAAMYQSEYIGGHDSFVFTLKPNLEGYFSTAQNDYFMLC